MSTGNRTRRRELGLLPEPSKCVGRKKDGTPCRRSPIKGATVCRAHGGAAPQVQRKAQERIAHASDVAVLQILALLQAPDTPAPVKLAAAKDLLDRASISGKTTIEVEVPLWQQVLDGIVATVPTDGETAVRPLAEREPPLDPLVIEAERADQHEELARYQAESGVSEHFHPDAFGSDWTPAPRPTTTAPAPAPEVRPPNRANGDDRLPRPRWQRDAEAERLRREAEFTDDVDHPTPHGEAYRRSEAPRRGRVAGRRR